MTARPAAPEEFEVAVSFADDDRAYVRRVVVELRRRGVRVFSDDPHDVGLWGKDLVVELDDVFQRRSRFVLIFISRAYVRDQWSRHELRGALARAIRERREYVLPARFDGTVVPGLPDTVRHVDCALVTPERLAGMVCEKVGHTGAAPPARPAFSAASGLGELVLGERVEQPAPPLSVAFGAGDTVLVADHTAAVHRWSLSDGSRLPGLPRGEKLGVATRVVAGTEQPAVAIPGQRRVTLVHLDGARRRSIEVPLGSGEYLVPAGGRRFATYSERRISVRDFADGAVLWEQPCPHSLATVTISADGESVAAASATELTAVSRRDARPRRYRFTNLPGAGSLLSFSPGGEELACGSFREILVVRPDTDEVVYRRPLSWGEVAMNLGVTWFPRLRCLPGGDVLWLVNRRIALVRGSRSDLLWLPHEGRCDDIALDPTGCLVAVVTEGGLLQVYRIGDRGTPAEAGAPDAMA